EGERWDKHCRPPCELCPVGTRPPALGGRVGHEIAECGAIRGEVIRQQREVGEPAPACGDLPPAMRQAATEIVERDDLEIASVRERDQRVARQTVSVLAAW